MSKYSLKFYKDGTVSYWSVYLQQRLRTLPPNVPDRERAAMNDAERSALDEHQRKLERQWIDSLF